MLSTKRLASSSTLKVHATPGPAPAPRPTPAPDPTGPIPLPHWTEPPSGEVPQIAFDADDDDDVWSSGGGPRFRSEGGGGWDDADFGDDRPDGDEVTAVDAGLGIEHVPAHDLGLEVVEHLSNLFARHGAGFDAGSVLGLDLGLGPVLGLDPGLDPG